MALTSATRRLYRPVATMVTALLLLAATTGIAAASQREVHKKKSLSLTSVTVTGGVTDNSAAIWIAQYQGFWKQLGLSVTFLAAPSSTTQTTIFLSGQAQFALDAPSADLPAIEQGAPFTAIDMSVLGGNIELVLSQTAADQYQVPASSNTAAGTLKQFQALKGSHLVVDVANTTSSTYFALIYLSAVNHLTMGVGCTTCDLNIASVGSPANAATAFQAGKTQAFVSTPPTTIVSSPASIVLQLNRIQPIPKVANDYLSTTSTLIQQHPDTVQAMVTGMVKAQYWLTTHASQAEKDSARGLAIYGGITSPEEAEYLWADSAPQLSHPYPTRAAYSYTVQEEIYQLGSKPPISYQDYVIPRFVVVAGKALGIKVT